MYETLAILAIFTFVYSIIGGRIERSWLSGPIIFCTFGVLVGPRGFNLLPIAADSATIKSLAELTLALILFTDAASVNFAALRKNAQIPLRLLLIGLPLTIALGCLVGTILFGPIHWFEIAVLATILAPTDAALGKPVITNNLVPEPYREGLNIESGLNDGICVPVLLIFLELATMEPGGETTKGMVFSHFSAEIGIGGCVGIGLVAAAVFLGRIAAKRGWVTREWSRISVAALAMGCFGLAQVFGGSGFIAAFVGGLVFDRLLGEKRKPWLEEAESLGDLFALVTWVTFGALVLNPAPATFRWQELLFSLLSLTLIRMLPVFIALSGMGLKTEAKLFIGWFGPRGLASVVFCVIAFDAGLLHESGLARIVTITIFLSILLHGITANPWAVAIGRRTEKKDLKTGTD